MYSFFREHICGNRCDVICTHEYISRFRCAVICAHNVLTMCSFLNIGIVIVFNIGSNSCALIVRT